VRSISTRLELPAWGRGGPGGDEHRALWPSTARAVSVAGAVGCSSRQPLCLATRRFGCGGEVLPEVEAVGDLHRVRRSGPGAICIGTGPVPADHRWRSVLEQQSGQWLRVASRDQIDDAVVLAVDQHGAVVVSSFDREVVDAEHAGQFCSALRAAARRMTPSLVSVISWTITPSRCGRSLPMTSSHPSPNDRSWWTSITLHGTEPPSRGQNHPWVVRSLPIGPGARRAG
jgi:hypothetical protein